MCFNLLYYSNKKGTILLRTPQGKTEKPEELLHYTTSYEVSRSTEAVVGYASIVMRR